MKHCGASMSVPAATPDRPAWIPADLYPFEDRYAELDGSRVHYVEEGSGPPLLLLHGNPAWSFLYREIIKGLAGSYRCIAVDYPGFGLSRPAPGYAFTPAEHAHVIEQLILQLDLNEVTMMVQDWGGPIGFAAATRHPERFAAFIIGNTWAWPKADPGTQLFSRLLGGPLGSYLILRRNFFIENILANNVKLRTLPEQVMDAYRGPFPTAESRRPMHGFRARSLRADHFWPRSSAACRRLPSDRRCSSGRRRTSPSASPSGGAGRRFSRTTTR